MYLAKYSQNILPTSRDDVARTNYRDMSHALTYFAFGLKMKLGQGQGGGFKSNLSVPLDMGNEM